MWKGVAARDEKHQNEKHQIPNPKIQKNTKLQASKEPRRGSLRFGESRAEVTREAQV